MQDKINEDQLSTVVIDLGAARRGEVNESYLTVLGTGIQYALEQMFAASPQGSLKLKGAPAEIQAFLATLGAERNYIDSFKRYGLDNPNTYSDGRRLSNAARDFERKTGLKWPFK